jgi:hypothetical protein
VFEATCPYPHISTSIVPFLSCQYMNSTRLELSQVGVLDGKALARPSPCWWSMNKIVYRCPLRWPGTQIKREACHVCFNAFSARSRQTQMDTRTDSCRLWVAACSMILADILHSLKVQVKELGVRLPRLAQEYGGDLPFRDPTLWLTVETKCLF